jgi:hypothetical protein
VLVVLVAGTLVVVVLAVVLLVLVVGVLALLALLALAVAVVVLGTLRMSGHLGWQMEARWENLWSSCQHESGSGRGRGLAETPAVGGAYLKQWALGRSGVEVFELGQPRN